MGDVLGRMGGEEAQCANENPLDQICDEILDNILQYINDPEDLWTLSNVNTRLRDLVRPKLNWKIALPFLIKQEAFLNAAQLEVVHVKRFRLVCRRWAHDVRQHCEALLLKKIEMRDPPVSPWEPDVDTHSTMTCNITHRHQQERMLKKLRATRKIHPFFSRSLTLSIPNRTVDNFGDFSQTTLQVLPIVGSDLWELKVIFSATLASQHHMYKFVQKCVLHTPNLKSLAIIKGYGGDEPMPVSEEDVATHPFPKLEHLERLDYDNIELPFVKAILTANEHVKRIKRINSGREFEFLEYTKPESLSVDLDYLVDLRNAVRGKNWDMKHLHLDLSYTRFYQAALFKLIHQFRSTLETLVLSGDEVRGKGVLDLPKLTIFKCYLGLKCSDITFLVHCRELKILSVCIPHYDVDFVKSIFNRKDESEIVKFRGHLQTLDQTSNIWMVFPKLVEVRLVLGGTVAKTFKRIPA